MIDQSGQLSYPVSANKTAANVFTTLSRYLYHRRWVWTMQHASSMPISMQAVGCMLSNLTKYVCMLASSGNDWRCQWPDLGAEYLKKFQQLCEIFKEFFSPYFECLQCPQPYINCQNCKNTLEHDD